MLEVLLPKEDYEVDVLYWAAGCHGRWLGFIVGVGGGGSVVAAALLSNCGGKMEEIGNWRPPFPLRWFGWRALSLLVCLSLRNSDKP